MYSWLGLYSDLNPERFNEDLINLRKSDSVLKHINSIFEALEVINGVKFLGSTLDTDESKFLSRKNKNGKREVNIEETRQMLATFKFKLTDSATNEEKIIEKQLFFPKLIDGTYFILNGSKFFPIYQIIDSATYNNNNFLTLKTLLMGVKIRTKDIKLYSLQNDEYTGNYKLIDLFKTKLNYLAYFFADRGFEKTMDYILEDDIENWKDNVEILSDEEYNKNSYENIVSFKLGSSSVIVIDKKYFDYHNKFFMNLIEILSDKDVFQIMDHQYWITSFGKIFSRNKNKYDDKAKDIIISFRRILDNSTKETLRLKDKNKEDIFAIIRWMVRNFESLILQDNMDLKYKRIRINEYLCYDLLIKMSKSTYRLLNKQEITMKDREQLFSTLPPNFLIKKMGSNELLRYAGNVNAIEIFNPSLKFSFRGFQGLGEGTKNVNQVYRGIHPSYLGRICLTTGSNSDPGMTGTFSPFMETFGFYFSDNMLDENEAIY